MCYFDLMRVNLLEVIKVMKYSINKKIYNLGAFRFYAILLGLFIIILTYKSYKLVKIISPIYFNKSILLPTIYCVLLLISFSMLFKDKISLILSLIINLSLSIIYIFDIFYFKLKGDLLSVVSIKNGTLAKLIYSNSIFKILTFKDMLFFIDLIFLIPIIFIYFKKVKFTVPYYFYAIPSILFITLGITLNNKYINKLDKEQPGLLKNMSNKLYVSRMIGNINYHALDGYNYFFRWKEDTPNKYSNEEIYKFFKEYSKQNSDNNPYFKKGEGKNLIVLQLESLQEFVINEKINGKEITPNLNKFIKRSVYYKNCFYQVGEGNTSDAEFLFNNSLYPSSNGATYYKYAGNTFNSLPKSFREKGYNSYVFHGNNEGFWNRHVMYNSIGFDKFYGIKDFSQGEILGMGISDKSFFKEGLEKMDTFKQPFYSFLISLTSHYPFKDVEEIFPVGNLKDTFMGDYLNSIHYLDKELGIFLDNLEKKGYLDNSIIVMYGDHNGVPPYLTDEIYKVRKDLVNNNFNNFMLNKVPLIVHFPEDKYKSSKNECVGQIDMYNLVANLYGIKNPYIFGRDILSTSNNKVLFNNGSFIYEDILYISNLNKYFNINTGQELIENQRLIDIKALCRKELDMAQQVLKDNLLLMNKE
ncbi:LTA synthase family protein [Clostridium tetani]|nr:LTA synthase family protein [Clostridium tetani]